MYKCIVLIMTCAIFVKQYNWNLPCASIAQTQKQSVRMNQPKSVSLATTYGLSSLRIEKKLAYGLPHLINVQA